MDYPRFTTEQKITGAKLDFAKKLRREMTRAERHFWNYVRRRRFPGYRFRRQQVLDGFILDFYCSKLKVGIEIDGPIHDTQKDYDRYRKSILQKRGIRILRFRNEEVLRDVGAVINKIFYLVNNNEQ